ncbi:30S ribosomal protein S6 [Marinitoga sp. 1135]|uniref:30S ribosomal protein S6 n=1 Tax=unclassified Marinitoga TaxID=2640159 RepID=UPI0005A2E355|nr:MULTISPECIES: 30S ribosomal protein S6 [Marinitoga]APT75390.1 30S ribosomal protein S6 [Marinitoga sp. 1137]NUU95122.1 30S ribosomal protein S6 [Marinitoga sp. 1135]NUU97054.1 30S ribosomal protein S6 [Marinitoga sp. 1138]
MVVKRIYEVMFIVSPELSEEARNAEVEKVKSWIEEKVGGEIEHWERWGMRKLAYRTHQGYTEGDYAWGIFKAEPDKVNELDGLFRINSQNTFRWQVFRREDLEKAEKNKAKKAEETQEVIVEEPVAADEE